MGPGKTKKTDRFQSSPIGNEITCIMFGIRSAILNDIDKLRKALAGAAKHDNLKILKEFDHCFEPKGYTALFLIQESHLAIHTYPEHNSLVFNVYSCRNDQDGVKAFEFFKKAMKPKKIIYRQNKVIINESLL